MDLGGKGLTIPISKCKFMGISELSTVRVEQDNANGQGMYQCINGDKD